MSGFVAGFRQNQKKAINFVAAPASACASASSVTKMQQKRKPHPACIKNTKAAKPFQS
jgi:hypothetical protein